VLNYAVTFLIIALIAGILGFGVIAGTAASIATGIGGATLAKILR
jgi:uncharacterized membrane protein YtjA (UPF0391 family)